MKTRVILPVALLLLAAALLLNTALATEEKEKTAEEKTREWQKTVEEIKGMKFKKPVASEAVDEAGMKKVMEKEIRYTKSEKDIKTALEIIGFFAPEIDSVKVSDILDIMSKSTAGLYIPRKDKYYYLETLTPEAQGEVAVHELTHALQDQHINLTTFIEKARNNLDRQGARKALMEGEATCVGLEYGFQTYGKGIIDMEEEIGDLFESSIEDNIPFEGPVIREMIMFPYVYGSTFYQRYLKVNGWKKTADLYKNPPETTEQILHEQKFITGMDYPVEVSFSLGASSLGKGWEMMDSTTVGEYDMLLLLGENQKDNAASWRAVIGWDGDRWTFYRNKEDKSRAAVAVTAWDSEEDAKEFLEFLKAHITKRWKDALAAGNGAALDEKGGISFRWTTRDRTFFARRDKQTVYAALNIPAAALEKVEKRLSKARIRFHNKDREQGKGDNDTTRAAEKAFLAKLEARLAPVTVTGNTVTGKTGKYQITLPEDEWEITSQPGDSGISLTAHSKKFETGSINIIEIPAIGVNSLEDALKQVREAYPVMLPNFTLLSESDTKLGGVPAHSFTFTCSQNAAKF
ncbi:MAG: hypothetical protein ABIH04_02760, partial [Planctomycetota bacterium]